MDISGNIRRLRLGRDVTQEKLAAALGVSFQTVSKWERGETYPDITLLPALAAYFGVTTDALLCVDDAVKQAKIKAFDRENYRLDYTDAAEHNERVIAMSRELYAEFPTDARVMWRRLYTMQREDDPDGDEIVRLGTEIIERGDSHERNLAIQTLAYHYGSLGDIETAEKHANMSGSLITSREQLLASVYSGEKRVKQAQENVGILLLLASLNLCNAYDPDDGRAAVECLKTAVNLYRAVDGTGAPSAAVGRRIIGDNACLFLARQYVGLGEYDDAFDTLGTLCDYAAAVDGTGKPPAAFSKLSAGAPQAAATKRLVAIAREHLGLKGFDAIRGDARFAVIDARLAAAAAT
ncbi:MAG: helix-turn-helix transcriptional regulator [Oscillospiraceae bacterium]|jgi:transcriptional regulator with XRE-family HTH domain|nr:helix-turn-helix transcriptional regulator [Oscillospiraceae bacterium]